MASPDVYVDVSSVQLLRESILRCTSSSVLDNHKRYGHREEIPNTSQPSIEVKFLERSCSSFSSEEKNKEEAKPPKLTSKKESLEENESKYLPLPDFEISGSFEEKEQLEGNDYRKRLEEIESPSIKPKHSSKNNLKLAIRSKSDGIFEDCSTYNIYCPDASPKFQSNEIFTNSIAGSYSSVESTDFENSLASKYSYTDSEFASSNSVNNSDDQTSLCDTFFSHFANNDNAQLPKIQSQASRVCLKQQTSKNNQATKEEDVKESENISGSHHGGKRNSKKIRRRLRKNHSTDPFVYECPKCGVSYVIASKLPNDGVCLHCDMWTSVEPEFVKREKLLTWNTCRIC